MARNVFVIAELGSNPAPEWDLSRYCAAVAKTGADAVKVQLFKAEHFPEAEWAAKRPLEFPRERLSVLACLAHEYGLEAGASVFDTGAAVIGARHLNFLKLAAREQDNTRLFRTALAEARRWSCSQIYVSFNDWQHRPVRLPKSATPFFTVSRYPTPMALAVWWALQMPIFMRAAPRWGWSSHTRGALDCVLAVRLGATVIEKHFTLGDPHPGPPPFGKPPNRGGREVEAGHSLWPDQFKRMVERCKRS